MESKLIFVTDEGEENGEYMVNRNGVSFQGNENFLKQDSHDGCINVVQIVTNGFSILCVFTTITKHK
jgi:hypothetical protein